MAETQQAPVAALESKGSDVSGAGSTTVDNARLISEGTQSFWGVWLCVTPTPPLLNLPFLTRSHTCVSQPSPVQMDNNAVFHQRQFLLLWRSWLPSLLCAALLLQCSTSVVHLRHRLHKTLSTRKPLQVQ